MNGTPTSSLLLLVLSIGLVIFSSPILATEGDEDSEPKSTQQTNMEDNLQDSVPASDLEDQQQSLENPRLVVHENLAETPEIEVISPEEAADPTVSQQTQEETEDLEDELQLEVVGRGRKLLSKSDRLMELSRRPLTYVQENVPFLTKRNIIFFGRLELDGAYYTEGVLEDESGFNIRRFRLGLAGRVKFLKNWNYKAEVDLTDGDNTLSDFYLSWRSKHWGTIRIGNQKVAQTLSGQTSSLSIPFMERPLPILSFTLTRRLGIGWDTHLKKMGANVTVFTRDPNKGVGSQGWAIRSYLNPSREKFHVIHVGASFMQLSSDDDARMRSRPESYVTDTSLVDTGVFTDVGTSSALGLELAGARGPYTIRGEFYRTEWTRSNDSNPNFKGWYAEASWFLTGEMAHYREGKFIRPNIISDRGAWEVAARVSTIDLNDQEVVGGTQKNLSLGVNWYSKTHWRFMGNLIKVNAKDGPYGDQKPWIVQFRIQYYF